MRNTLDRDDLGIHIARKELGGRHRRSIVGRIRKERDPRAVEPHQSQPVFCPRCHGFTPVTKLTVPRCRSVMPLSRHAHTSENHACHKQADRKAIHFGHAFVRHRGTSHRIKDTASIASLP